MTFSKSFVALGFVAAVSLAASAPAYAQRGGGHGGGGGHAVAGGHGGGGGGVRGGGGGHGGPVYGGGHGVAVGHPGGYPGGYYGGHYGGRYAVVGYAPYRPYYYYRPGVSIGFYLGWGYPYYYGGYGYSYAYPYPYYYNPYPYYSYPSYSYPAQQPYPQQPYEQQPYQQQPYQQQPYQQQPSQGTVTAQPGGQNAAYGGVRITGAPHDGQVYVDGYYAGIVDDFDGDNKHLNLTAGVHQVEIRVNGRQPVSFDVNVPPNQTVTIRVQ